MEVEGGVEWTHELLVDGVCEHGHAPGHVHHGEVAHEGHGGHGAGAAAADLVLQQVGGVELETGGHAHVIDANEATSGERNIGLGFNLHVCLLNLWFLHKLAENWNHSET